jgi:phosphoglycerate dehydrogenase-like enzyme
MNEGGTHEPAIGQMNKQSPTSMGTVAVHGGRFGETMLHGLRTVMPDTRFVPAGSEEAIRDADVLTTLADDSEGIASALSPGIRWVHVLGAGVDGFPLEVVGDRPVTCSRGAAAPAIAEWVLAVMLAFEKRLPESWLTEAPAHWNVASLGGLVGRTLGLVGIGAIGGEVARRALAFDMEVLALRRRDAPAPVEGVRVVSSLADLVTASDHVVLAAPATAATRLLFDRAAFSAVKRGAHFVNVARGSLVDQDALVEALDDGRVAMATLDVVDPEPLPTGHVLYGHPKVRLSPHISWSSPQSAVRTLQLFADNLRRFRAGEALASVVDRQAGY